MEKFVISKEKTGEFKFDFIDNKGNIIFSSGSYTRKTMCIKGIESVKRNSQDSSKFNRKSTLNSESYFNLKSFNGKFLGTSQMYQEKALRENAIEIIKSKVPTASIEDQSKK
ncbi:MAG: YegP family protein [Flavobacterium sp.]|uniref:YegP family protein n=1 Tax=Flavobacterium sp. TaxID=239 RepID=UPI002621B2E3|nr:YegP family protein [Flavobacterium sp.]MDD5151728.1 YegP family protein [Flavobacterium sp.]